MATQRYISTSFWDDAWIRSLDPSEKFLYLYLLTNTLTNIAGVYKITNARICFDTGYNEDTILKILDRFKESKKVYRWEDYIIIPTWPKHQKWQKRSKIKSGILSILTELSPKLLKYLEKIGYTYPIDTISIPYVYDTNYSDSEFDSEFDFDIDIDSDKKSFPPQQSSPSYAQDTGEIFPDDFMGEPKNWERIVTTWNTPEYKLPEFRMLMVNLPNWRDILVQIGQHYSTDEIVKAIQNYATLRTREKAITYGSLSGFLSKGVDKYADSGHPFENFQKTFADEQRELAEECKQAEESKTPEHEEEPDPEEEPAPDDYFGQMKRRIQNAN